MTRQAFADTIHQRLDNGELGELLERELGGKRGHLLPSKDADFLIEFADDASVPPIEKVEALISRTLKEWGYNYRFGYGTADVCLEVTVFCFDTGQPRAYLVMTFHYPHARRPSFIRVTTTKH